MDFCLMEIKIRAYCNIIENEIKGWKFQFFWYIHQFSIALDCIKKLVFHYKILENNMEYK